MKRLLVLTFLISAFSFSQKKLSSKIGQVSKEELKMTFYEKDSSANAIVLYEHANLYLDNKSDNLDNKTDFYHRIKPFKKEAFDEAAVKVMLREKEKIKNVKAVSYNISESGAVQKTSLLPKDIFKNLL